MRSARPSLYSLVGIASALCACRSPTQITFEITTNVPCAQIDDTSFASGLLSSLVGEAGSATSKAEGCVSTGNIGSIVAVPSGGDEDLVAVEVVTGIGVEASKCGPETKCIVAKRALRYIPHTPLVVIVDMSTQCEGVVCDGDQTCEQGVCVSPIIPDPSACAGNGCNGSVLQPADGGGPPGDAGADATVLGDATVPEDAGEAGDASDASTACVDACVVNATQCGSATSVETCEAQLAACAAWGPPSTCPDNLGTTPYVCERYGAPSCVDPNWAEWPMPNGPAGTPLPPNLEHLADDGDGTVSDLVTGLMWQKAIAPIEEDGSVGYTQPDALAYCAGLSLGGRDDWRLPSLLELASLLDLSRFNPAIDETYFPGTPADYFWTSTPLAATGDAAWNLDFGSGLTGGGVSTDTEYVRCVR